MDELTLLLRGDIPPHWEPSPTIGSRLAVTPFFALPAPLRRQAMETFPPQKLFREPQVEVLAWLSLDERERAAQRLEELVLAGAIDDRTWGAVLHQWMRLPCVACCLSCDRWRNGTPSSRRGIPAGWRAKRRSLAGRRSPLLLRLPYRDRRHYKRR